MTVKLRQRKKGNKISLYLDYYHKGNRKYEYLQLYLHPEPEEGKLPKAQKEENRKTLKLAENIRAKRMLEVQNGVYGFEDVSKLKGSFLEYMEMQMEKRKKSKGNYDNWDSTLNHLKDYVEGDVTFAQLDRKFVQGFRDYLLNDARTKSEKPLAQNSAYSYFNKFRAALKQAVKDNIIRKNPANGVKAIKQAEPQREFLTYEELQKLAQTECESDILKQAFLFSALTGLRWSDIQKLVWSEVQHSEKNGHYIRFRQKKTKGAETLPISEQARNLLGDKGPGDERVFKGLKYSAWHNLKLKQWVLRAGIDKDITFHCARHTYATLQLTMGTDIYTVSKLLGHRELKTTQVYAKIIDEKKKEAANKINLDL